MRKSWCVWISLLAVLLLASVTGLEAQVQTATISGTVTDASGGAVAGAKIDVKNTGTGITQSTVTDAQGRYTVPQLQIGTYDVTATATGFQTAVHAGITLTVGSSPVVDFSMQVGQVQQTVTVESQVTQVDTTSSTVSSLVNQTQLAQLPLNGRDVEQLVLLAPGVQQVTVEGQFTGYYGREPAYSVAGSRMEGQAFLLDDQNMQNFFQRGIGANSAGTALGVEGIAEFQTLTNTYSAQFGGNGAAVNAVSKAGTNNLHGGAYEFVRNTVLDARNFFNLPPFQNRQPFNRNQFGADLGGPVVKNKAFFFVNYEGLRQVLGTLSTVTAPNLVGWTPAAGNAFFGKVTATDPTTIAAITNTLALYQTYAPATGCATSTCVLTTQAPNPTDENYFLGRFDYTFSGNDSIFARYVVDRSTVVSPFSGTAFANGNGWPETDHDRNQFITVEERHIFSPTLINSARLSYSRTVTVAATTSGPTVNGVDPLTPAPQYNSLQCLPGNNCDTNVTITPFTGLGPGGLSTGINDTQNKAGGGDDIIWTHGAHSFTFGSDLVRDDTNTLNLYQINGTWSFLNMTNFLAGTAQQLNGTIPNSLAVSLFGHPQYAHRDTRAWLVDPYIQDTWKVLPKLTINWGVRYDFMSNPVILNGAGFNVINAPASCAFGPTVGNTCDAGASAINNMWVNGNPADHNIDPRIGIAYDPFADHKTSIRAGFAMFHDVVMERTFDIGLFDNPPEDFGLLTLTKAPNGAIVSPQWGYPFQTAPPNVLANAPAGYQLPLTLEIGPGTDSRINVTPTQIQWNFTVQHDFSGTVLSVGYVGSSGYHLINETNANPPSLATVNQLGGFSTLQGSSIIGDPLINPNLGTLSLMEAYGHSKYDSLQVGVNRRLTHGLTGQISYTWSHCIDNGSATYGIESGNNGGNENPYNYSLDTGNCTYDIRNALRVNGVYTLPFHGNQFVEGWQFAGILTESDGPWITPTVGISNYNFGNSERPNAAACSNGKPLIENTGAPTGTGILWFNPTCFAAPGVGIPGNVGRTSIPGPSISNLDFSIIKDTKITRINENFVLEVRLEGFDLFNTPNFSLPNATAIVGTGAAPAINPTAGIITSTIGNVATTTGGGQRLFQIGLKAMF